MAEIVNNAGNSFIAHVNLLVRNIQLLTDINGKFSREDIEALTTLVSLNLDTIIEDLRKGSFSGNRKLDINLLHNLRNFSAELTKEELIELWSTASNRPAYHKVVFTFTNRSVLGIDLSPVVDTNTALYDVITNNFTLATYLENTQILAKEDVVTDSIIRVVDVDINTPSNVRSIALVTASDTAKVTTSEYDWHSTTSSLEVIAFNLSSILSILSKYDELKEFDTTFRTILDNMEELLVLIENIDTVTAVASSIPQIMEVYDALDTLLTVSSVSYTYLDTEVLTRSIGGITEISKTVLNAVLVANKSVFSDSQGTIAVYIGDKSDTIANLRTVTTSAGSYQTQTTQGDSGKLLTGGVTAGTFGLSIDSSTIEKVANKTQIINSQSTNEEYPSAKAVNTSLTALAATSIKDVKVNSQSVVSEGVANINIGTITRPQLLGNVNTRAELPLTVLAAETLFSKSVSVGDYCRIINDENFNGQTTEIYITVIDSGNISWGNELLINADFQIKTTTQDSGKILTGGNIPGTFGESLDPADLGGVNRADELTFDNTVVSDNPLSGENTQEAIDELVRRGNTNSTSIDNLTTHVDGIRTVFLGDMTLTKVLGGTTNVPKALLTPNSNFELDKTLIVDNYGILGVYTGDVDDNTIIVTTRVFASAGGSVHGALLGNIATRTLLPENTDAATTLFGRTPGIDDYCRIISDSEHNGATTEIYIIDITDGTLAWGNELVINTSNYQAQTTLSDAGKILVGGAVPGTYNESLAFDTAPTSGSNNLLTSGAIKDALGAATVLTSNKSFYVSGANGSDDNDGTSAFPWKTVQKAFDIIKRTDQNGYTITVYVDNSVASYILSYAHHRPKGAILVTALDTSDMPVFSATVITNVRSNDFQFKNVVFVPNTTLTGSTVKFTTCTLFSTYVTYNSHLFLDGITTMMGSSASYTGITCNNGSTVIAASTIILSGSVYRGIYVTGLGSYFMVGTISLSDVTTSIATSAGILVATDMARIATTTITGNILVGRLYRVSNGSILSTSTPSADLPIGTLTSTLDASSRLISSATEPLPVAQGGTGLTSAVNRFLTQAEYNALSTTEKNNGTTYFIYA